MKMESMRRCAAGPARHPAKAAVFGVAAWGAAVAPGLAQPAEKPPPMNDFYQAFYTCANGAAFMMSYDSEAPTQAEMTTSNDNRHYQMKRADDAKGVKFVGGGVRFWTDGKTVVVEGAKVAYRNCRTRAS